jgi:ankyrin repeat protein
MTKPKEVEANNTPSKLFETKSSNETINRPGEKANLKLFEDKRQTTQLLGSNILSKRKNEQNYSLFQPVLTRTTQEQYRKQSSIEKLANKDRIDAIKSPKKKGDAKETNIENDSKSPTTINNEENLENSQNTKDDDSRSVSSSRTHETESHRGQSSSRTDLDDFYPSQCGDLTAIKFANDLEKYLVIRLYSNTSKLYAILEDLRPANLKYFLTTPDENDCLPLYYAIKADNLNTIKMLLKMGSTPDKTTINGDPALHLACLTGSSLQTIEYLISLNDDAYLNQIDQEGWTILHCACNQGHLNIVKYLIEVKHMNPNVKDSKNRFTGLQLATINNRLDIIEYFLSFHTLSSIAIRQNKSASTMNTISQDTNGNTNAPKIDLPKDLKANTGSNILNNALNYSSNPNNNLNQFKSQFSYASVNRSTSANQFALNQLKNNSVKSMMSLNSKVNAFMKKSKPAKSTRSRMSIDSYSRMSLVSEIFPNDLGEEFNNKPRVHLESMNIYANENKKKVDSLFVYNNFVIDLNSLNSDGQNVLHLACRYGKIEAANLLLRKYGSNQLNINAKDFKGRTCLDLAWQWTLNCQNVENTTPVEQIKTKNDQMKDEMTENNKISLFHSHEDNFYVQRNMLVVNNQIESQMKLINLLNQYGAKFSSHKELLYDIESLRQFDKDNINLPSTLFYPDDHVSFNNLRLNKSNFIPIMTYLKCILYVFKFNIPTMFLRDSTTTNEDVFDIYDFNDNLKKAFAYNFNQLITFIKNNVIDSFERNIYYEHIEMAFELLVKD